MVWVGGWGRPPSLFSLWGQLPIMPPHLDLQNPDLTQVLWADSLVAVGVPGPAQGIYHPSPVSLPS